MRAVSDRAIMKKVVMSAAQDINVVTTYGDIDLFLSDEVKQFARIFYVRLYSNFDSNLDEARANTQRDAYLLLLT